MREHPLRQIISEENNFNNIGLVESEGEFPDTTNGELSVEKTIEEQGLGDVVLGGTNINSDENTNMSNEERDDYYVAPNVEAVGDETFEELSKSEKLRREIADMNDVADVADLGEDPEIAAAAAEAAVEEDRRTAEMKRRQFQKELLDLGVDPRKKFVGLETDRDPHLRGRRSPWMSAAMLRDPQTRLTLEREKRSAVSPFLTSGLGAGSVSPPPRDGNQKNEEEKEEEFKEAWEAQRRREMGFRYDKEDLEKAEKAAAAAAKDPKVGAAANAAADEWDEGDEDLLFDWEQGGGRRKRRRRRRRTRKKKGRLWSHYHRGLDSS